MILAQPCHEPIAQIYSIPLADHVPVSYHCNDFYAGKVDYRDDADGVSAVAETRPAYAGEEK